MNPSGSSRPEPATLPIVVTGVGPVSAIGSGREAFWQSLMAGKPGVGPITLCDASPYPSKVAAEIRDFRLRDFLPNGRLLARSMPRPVQLALAAAALAIDDASLDLATADCDRIGVHVGTSVGNLDEIATASFAHRARGVQPPQHEAFLCFNHSAACTISSVFDLRGPAHTTTTGCNSALDALGQSMQWISSGALDAVLVVGTDCEVVVEVLAVLNAAGSLATRYNESPARASRPFERHRDGNVTGEGAGALLLEAEPHARERGARIYARLSGYSMCAAGRQRQYEPRQPQLDVRPCVRALRGAMQQAAWQPADVDLVNANGSSSVNYDRLEALALGEAFGAELPRLRVHSIKSMLGQHGAGSSALQAIAACLSLSLGAVPPTINYEEPDPECGPLRIVTSPERFQPHRVLVHSIGFGGFYYSAAALASVNGVRPERCTASEPM